MPKTRVPSSSSRLPLTGVELDGESAPPPRTMESVKSNSWTSSNRQLRLRSSTYPELKIKINSGSDGTPWEGSTSSLASSISGTTAAEPFNLISFFPTHTPTEMRSEDSGRGGGGGRGREWNWLNEEGRSVNSEDFSGTETEYEFDELRLENEDKIREIGIGIADVDVDVAGQVIDGEDKFGILGLTSGNVAKILLEGVLGRLLGKLGDFGGGAGGERRVVNEDYEPEDIEEVCSRYREKRNA